MDQTTCSCVSAMLCRPSFGERADDASLFLVSSSFFWLSEAADNERAGGTAGCEVRHAEAECVVCCTEENIQRGK